MLGAGFGTRPTLDIPATDACRALDPAKKLSEGVKYFTPVALDVTGIESRHDGARPGGQRRRHHRDDRDRTATASTAFTPSRPLRRSTARAARFCPSSLHSAVTSPPTRPLTVHSATSSRGRPAASCGVLLTLSNAAKHSKDGQVVDVPSKDIMATAKPYFMYPGYTFVARPSLPRFIEVRVDLVFIGDASQQVLSSPMTWKEATNAVVGAASSGESDHGAAIVSNATFIPRQSRLTRSARRSRRSTSRRGCSVLAKLVGVPCGVAVKQVLNGTVAERRRPRVHELKINDDIMKKLMDKYGFYLTEKALS
ncbi:saccharopine dehydrogenase [NADP(+), L-glutamate-forming] [Colletotrichum liriopes]|uniref:Saccharopine dehydrogenase [NADP(+), L-glutamate-forming] n=1 Tax=Colletotrichum liriopes TaxID=708192 RepID=A0AA37GK34_9PEZI|nr:saccharopine dehydrogenase [NADP(+), L-glutamate-forming] [Colletotrichum liriopes]